LESPWSLTESDRRVHGVTSLMGQGQGRVSPGTRETEYGNSIEWIRRATHQMNTFARHVYSQGLSAWIDGSLINETLLNGVPFEIYIYIYLFIYLFINILFIHLYIYIYLHIAPTVT